MEAKFNKLYENQGYFDRYNGSVFGSAFLLLVFFIIFSYAYIQKRITPIKKNWSQERCSPMVIPFAGLINAPKKSNKFQFTSENFSYCVKSAIKETASLAIKPFEAVLNLFVEFLKNINNAVNNSRKVLSSVRTESGNISADIMSRILNILIPFQKMIIHVKESISKTHAVLVSGMYASLASMLTLFSALFNIQKTINKIIAAAVAAIAAMWFIPFVGFEMAAAATVALTAVTIPFDLVTNAINKIENLSGLHPSCFKKGTLIRGIDNTLYSIESIPLGTTLMRGGEVTAVFELSAKNETMYKLGNVTVSGSHKVRYEKEWVYVSSHPDAIKINNFEDDTIYCLNTTGKKIQVGDYMFMDWDEIPQSELSRYGCETTREIFDKHENGFSRETIINTREKGSISITAIEIGDVLEQGEIVIGKVRISNKEVFDYGSFVGTKGLSLIQKLDKKPYDVVHSRPVLYHLLTNTGDFIIKEDKVKDYNWNIDYLKE